MYSADKLLLNGSQKFNPYSPSLARLAELAQVI